MLASSSSVSRSPPRSPFPSIPSRNSLSSSGAAGVQVPVEVRTQHGEERAKQGTLEMLKVKILLLGPEDAPNAVRVECSSEADLFFHYTHVTDEKVFSKIQEQQKLVVDFADYPGVLIRMLNSCIKEPHVQLAIFTMYNENDARLDFIQNMEYKFVELMYCSFSRSPDEVVQHHITYRYSAMKHKLAASQARLNEITNLVKIKNPSLLLQLQKSASGPSTASTSGQTGAFGRR